jgi:hypothetical protein
MKLEKEGVKMAEMVEIITWSQDIDKIIRELNRKQTVFFVWLCSMRVLPFIGLTGSFNFWEDNKDVNRHLYNILNILDIVANYDDSTTYIDVNAIAVAGDTLRDASRTSGIDVASLTAKVNAVTVELDAILYAINTIVASMSAAAENADIDVAKEATKAAGDAARAARAAGAAGAARAAGAAGAAGADIQQYSKLQDIILEDILYIKNGKYHKFNNDIGLYGDTWNNFQKALNDVGCGYWGRLYKNIFQSGFKIDKKAFKMRLSVLDFTPLGLHS